MFDERALDFRAALLFRTQLRNQRATGNRQPATWDSRYHPPNSGRLFRKAILVERGSKPRSPSSRNRDSGVVLNVFNLLQWCFDRLIPARSRHSGMNVSPRMAVPFGLAAIVQGLVQRQMINTFTGELVVWTFAPANPACFPRSSHRSAVARPQRP